MTLHHGLFGQARRLLMKLTVRPPQGNDVNLGLNHCHVGKQHHLNLYSTYHLPSPCIV